MHKTILTVLIGMFLGISTACNMANASSKKIKPPNTGKQAITAPTAVKVPTSPAPPPETAAIQPSTATKMDGIVGSTKTGSDVTSTWQPYSYP
jgi:hypothetical protein